MPIQLPPNFEQILAKALPENEIAPLLDSLNWTPHSSVRINKAKSTEINPEFILTTMEYANDVFILKSRPEFVADPAFHAGKYYVQEASSAIIGAVLEICIKDKKNNIQVLDLCAAPGGKSTHIASVLRYNDILVANEVIHSRTGILAENLVKWGKANHLITRSDASRIGNSGATFDVIVADLPCSGEGLFRKDPESISYWSEENVIHCSLRQKRIAHDIWPALKPGGIFIYSTCTLNRRENEDNILELKKELNAEILELEFPQNWNLFSLESGCYRLLPHRSIGEGFFFAILRKPEENFKPKKGIAGFKKSVKKYTAQLPLPEKYLNYLVEDKVCSFQTEDQDFLFEYLHLLPDIYSFGTQIGRVLEKRGKTLFKPDHELALIADLHRGYYPELDLEENAIKYLRRDSIPNSAKKEGMHLAVWKNIPLGFANGIQFQWNNLWPMDWRIRKNITEMKTIVLR
ncbi:MAG: rRNA cytosine-C5-methyltransferase [Bacteroidetes bacterium]|nr:rRNA cytosine-C5-methyltransferase [Bacteroidota bacterium]